MPNGAKPSGSSAPSPSASQRRVCTRVRPGTRERPRPDGACADTLKEGLLDEPGGCRGARHLEHVDATEARALHLEAKTSVVESLPAPREACALVHHEAADRVVALVAEFRAEVLVEFLDRHERLHDET